MSTEVESERSLVGLIAQVFCLIRFGARIGEDGFVVSVVTDETTGSARGGEGEGTLLGCF